MGTAELALPLTSDPTPSPAPLDGLPEQQLRCLRGLLRVLALAHRAAEGARHDGGRGAGRRDVEEASWGLVGMRVAAHPRLLFGAMRLTSRRSLARLLAVPGSWRRGVGARPSRRLELHLPAVEETLPAFLARLEAGECAETAVVESSRIEVAFDCRLEGAADDRRGPARPPRPLVFRTASGHLLSGETLDLDVKLLRDSPFLGVSAVCQHTPQRIVRLPPLIVHRGFVGTVLVPDGGERPETWLRRTRPFLAATANPEHLLDPRL